MTTHAELMALNYKAWNVPSVADQCRHYEELSTALQTLLTERDAALAEVERFNRLEKSRVQDALLAAEHMLTSGLVPGIELDEMPTPHGPNDLIGIAKAETYFYDKNKRFANDFDVALLLARMCWKIDKSQAEVTRLTAENERLGKKLLSKRATFQAGRDSYHTPCVAMNTDDEAWDEFIEAAQAGKHD